MKIMKELISWQNAVGFLREQGRLLTLDRHSCFLKYQEISRRLRLSEGGGGGVRTVHMFPPKQYKKNVQHLGTSQLATPPSHMRVPISLEEQDSLASSSSSSSRGSDLLFPSNKQEEKQNEKEEEDDSSPCVCHTSPSETSSLLSSSSSLHLTSSLSARTVSSQEEPFRNPVSVQDERRCSDTRNRLWFTSSSPTSSVTNASCPVVQQEQICPRASRDVETHQENGEESSRGQIDQVYKIVQELNNTRRWYHHQIWHAMTSRNWALLDSLFSQFL